MDDLRHIGSTFAASGGAGIKDLMARMGHDSERAAPIYQHQARGADKIITSTSTRTSKPSAGARTMTTAHGRPGAVGLMARNAMSCPVKPASNARINVLTS
jgi:hypothetical protein